MKFAKVYIFLIDKDEVEIKAFNYEFIARFMYKWYNNSFKIMTMDTDTQWTRRLIRNYMKDE